MGKRSAQRRRRTARAAWLRTKANLAAAPRGDARIVRNEFWGFAGGVMSTRMAGLSRHPRLLCCYKEETGCRHKARMDELIRNTALNSESPSMALVRLAKEQSIAARESAGVSSGKGAVVESAQLRDLSKTRRDLPRLWRTFAEMGFSAVVRRVSAARLGLRRGRCGDGEIGRN